MSLTHGLSLACLAAVAVINLLPVIGVLGADRLASAYGIVVDSTELEILLRHRALLFGLIGGFVLASIWLPGFRGAALLLAGLSMGGFLLLAWLVGDYGRPLGRIVMADGVGMVFAVLAVMLGALPEPLRG